MYNYRVVLKNGLQYDFYNCSAFEIDKDGLLWIYKADIDEPSEEVIGQIDIGVFAEDTWGVILDITGSDPFVPPSPVSLL